MSPPPRLQFNFKIDLFIHLFIHLFIYLFIYLFLCLWAGRTLCVELLEARKGHQLELEMVVNLSVWELGT